MIRRSRLASPKEIIVKGGREGRSTIVADGVSHFDNCGGPRLQSPVRLGRRRRRRGIMLKPLGRG